MILKRIIFLMSCLLVVAGISATGLAFDINISVPVPPPPPIFVPGPPPPPPPPQPMPLPEPVPYPEPMPEQGYPQQDNQQQEYPAEEYIPEGDQTPPQPLAIQEPDLVVVPGGEAQVYMVPNMVGVYFYDGVWYRHHHGVWFTSNVYNGSWGYVQPTVVPAFVVGISPAYALFLPPTYYRIHYRDFNSHWRTWDRERHWERERWYQNERRADVRQSRERQSRERLQRDRQIRDQRIKERDRRNDRSGRPGQRPGRPDKIDSRKTGHPDNMRQQKSGQPGSQKSGQFERGQKNQPKQLDKQKQQPKKNEKSREKPHDKDKRDK